MLIGDVEFVKEEEQEEEAVPKSHSEKPKSKWRISMNGCTHRNIIPQDLWKIGISTAKDRFSGGGIMKIQ